MKTKTPRFILLLVALTSACTLARATTVIPPSFDQLVGQAQTIFQGSVTDVRSQWVGEGNTRHIESYITFQVEDAIKGNPGESYTIRTYGGTVGEDTMGIFDGPVFNKGDRQILFVENNGQQVVPLVGLMYGQFKVQHDDASGLDLVKSHEGEAVKSVARFGHEGEAPSETEASLPNMTTDAFKAEIRNKLQSLQ
jgi:hypothetical protein